MKRVVTKPNAAGIGALVMMVLTVLVSPTAAVDIGTNYGTALGLGTTDIRQTILTIIQAALAFLGVLAILIVLYAGFLWTTSAGQEDKISRAKQLLRNALIGIVIILTSFAIVTFVFNSILSGVFGPGPAQCTIPSSETVSCSIRVCVDDGDGDANGVWGPFNPIPGCIVPDALTLVDFSPVDGAPICGLVQARFSANLDAATVDQSDITVECLQAADGGACNTQFPSGNLANNPVGSPLLEWIPDQEFEPGATYQVTFSGFSGQGGEQLPLALPPRQRSFTLGTTGDPTPPTVLSFAPQGTNVCTLAPVQAIFSETMRASTLYDENNLSVVEELSGAPHTGTFSHVVSSSGGVPFNTLSAGPSDNYLDFTEYRPTLIAGDINDNNSGIQDACLNHLDGNSNATSEGSVADDFSWTYTTSDDAECTPEITNITPDPGFYDGVGNVVVSGNDFTIAGELIFNNTVYSLNNCFDSNNLPNATCISLGDWTSNQITLSGVPAGEGISNGAITGDVRVFLPFLVSEPYAYNVGSPHVATIGTNHLVDGTPAGGAGQFMTLSGTQFGTGTGSVQFSTLDGSQTWNADLPCSAGWSETEIIAAVPNGIPQNDLNDADPDNDYYVVRVIDVLGNYSNVTPFVVDDITSSVGLCSINPTSGQVGNTAVLEGRGFGVYDSANDAILFGGITAFVNVGSWNNPIDSVSGRVPNIEPATIGVQVQKGADISNAVSFTVLPEDPPIIYEVDPLDGAPGTYVTITGANFGDNQGSSTLTIAGLPAEFNFPVECLAQGTTWTDSQIIAIVNSSFSVPPDIAGPVEITTAGGTAQTSLPFTVNTNQRPNLCTLIPDNGPAGTVVQALGDNFPQSSPPGAVTYFDGQVSSLFSYTTTAQGTDQIDSSVPGLAQTGPVVINAGTTISNALPFTVGSCTTGTNSCDTASEQCCTSGPFANSCMPLGQCFGQASESAYGWTFTTGDGIDPGAIPNPQVIEQCNRTDACEVGSVSSPSPLDLRDGPAPINSVVSVRFNQPMDLTTLTYGASNNIQILQCNGNASAAAFDPIACLNTVTNGLFALVVDWGLNGEDGFTFTPTLGTDLLPDTWYQVVLQADSIFNEVAGTSPLPLLGNQANDDTYRFEFRTRNSLNYADAGCLFIDPAEAVVDAGETRDYYTEISDEDNACVTINASAHQCQWQAQDPGSPPTPSTRASIITPPGPGFTASCDLGAVDAQAVGLSDTGLIPVNIGATILTQDPVITGGAELFVNGPPYVAEWFPDVAGICRNVAVDFTFNERIAPHTIRLGGEPSVCAGGELDGALSCLSDVDCAGSDPAATIDDGVCLTGPTVVLNDTPTFDPANNILADALVRNINGKTNVLATDYNTPDPLTLDPNTTYYVTVVGGSQGVRDVFGLPLDQSFHPTVPATNPPNHEWQFTTSEDFCACDRIQVDISEQDTNSGVAQEVTFANQTDDFFTCAGNGCADDRYDGTVPQSAPDPDITGNQHLYAALCYDITFDVGLPPIPVVAQYAWDASIPDNNFTPDPQGSQFGPGGLTSNQNVIRSEINNGRGFVLVEGAVSAQAGTNLSCFGGFNSGASCTSDTDCQNGVDDGVCLPIDKRASQTVQVTTFLCQNPWPPLQNTCQAGQCAVGGSACGVDSDCPSLPYEDEANNCNGGGSSCIDTNYSLLYCRDAGAEGFTGDLPALELDPLIIGANSEPLKDILFTMAPNDCVTVNGQNVCLQTGQACDPNPFVAPNCSPITPPDALGIRVLSNPDHLSPLTWYFGGSCADGSYCTEDSDCASGSSGSFINPAGTSYPAALSLSFNEGTGIIAQDSSAFGNNATLNSGASWTSGISGSALSVNAGGTASVSGGQTLGESTIDLWFNTADTTGTIFESDASISLSGGALNYSAGSCSLSAGALSLNDNAWHHLVAVNSSAGCSLYIDGVRRDNANASPGGLNYSGLTLGQGYDGWIDEVRVYSVALTDIQVNNLFGNICNQNVPNPGSPSSSSVDGYQALVDGRTTYVAGSNINVNQLFTNIYLMSYSAGANAQTQAIYNQLLSAPDGISRLELNTNFVDYSPNVRFCSANPAVACSTDLDCKVAGAGDFCDSLKDKVVRDVERFGDVQDIRLDLQSYEQQVGSFPSLGSGSYLESRSFSTWPSWAQTLSSTLGSSLPLDPINDFYLCNPSECSDGLDNDEDGLIDLNDPGCNGQGSGQSENPACNDGVDNDGDGLIDFNPDPQIGDPECLSLTDNNERTTQPVCFDGVDNDGDGLIDFPADPGCGSQSDDNEVDQLFHEVTCWDDVNLQFSCPIDSFVYGYEAVNGGESVNIFTEFEVADQFTFTGFTLPPAQVGDACFNFRSANLNDPDGDGIDDVGDNCPASACENPLDCYNPSQSDRDGDLLGDVCDPCSNDSQNDSDGDGFCLAQSHGLPPDNCPTVFNPDQTDTDNDGSGDACDFDCKNDVDGDGVCDEIDNCPTVFNSNQYNSDGLNTAAHPVDPQFLSSYANAVAIGAGFTDDDAGQVWPNGQYFGDVCDPNTDQDGDGYYDVPTAANSVSRDSCSYFFNAGFCGQHDESLPVNYAGTPYGQYDGCYNPDQIDFDNDSFGYACDAQVCGNNTVEPSSLPGVETCDWGDGTNFPCTGPNGLCNGDIIDGCYLVGETCTVGPEDWNVLQSGCAGELIQDPLGSGELNQYQLNKPADPTTEICNEQSGFSITPPERIPAGDFDITLDFDDIFIDTLPFNPDYPERNRGTHALNLVVYRTPDFNQRFTVVIGKDRADADDSAITITGDFIWNLSGLQEDPFNPSLYRSSNAITLPDTSGTLRMIRQVEEIPDGSGGLQTVATISIWYNDIEIFSYPGPTDTEQIFTSEGFMTIGAFTSKTRQEALDGPAEPDVIGPASSATFTYDITCAPVISCEYCTSTCETAVISACGNGIIEGTEICDDGNIVDGDGCSSTCGVEQSVASACGNGIREPGEECDGGVDCNLDCTLVVETACVDNDGDGYGSPGASTCSAGPENDCDDTDPNINPGNGTCALVAAFEFNEGAGTTVNDSALFGTSNDSGTITGTEFAWGSLLLDSDPNTYVVIPQSASPDLQLGTQATLLAQVSGVDSGTNVILSTQGSSALDYNYIFGVGGTGLPNCGPYRPFLWLSDGVTNDVYCATGQIPDPTTDNFAWHQVGVAWQSGPTGQVQFFIDGLSAGFGAFNEPVLTPKGDSGVSQRLIGIAEDSTSSIFDESGTPSPLPFGTALGQLYVFNDTLDTLPVLAFDSAFDSANPGGVPPVCGNDLLEVTEQCDDGNTLNGDGCDAACQNEPIAACGNGAIETGEQCDDSNTANGDGCSSSCSVESGYSCAGQPSVCTIITSATCQATGGGTCYYVSPGGSGVSTDINTPGDVQLTVEAASGGDYVYLLDGTYTNVQAQPFGNNAIVYILSKNLTAGAPLLRVVAYPGDSARPLAAPILDPNFTGTGIAVIDSNNLEIAGIEIQNSDTNDVASESGGLSLRNTDNIVVHDMIIHHTTGNTDGNMSGLHVKDTTNLEVYDNIFYDNYNPSIPSGNNSNMVIFAGGNVSVHDNVFYYSPGVRETIFPSCFKYKHPILDTSLSFEAYDNVAYGCGVAYMSQTQNSHIHNNIAYDSDLAFVMQASDPQVNMLWEFNTAYNVGRGFQFNNTFDMLETGEEDDIVFRHNIIQENRTGQGGETATVEIGTWITEDDPHYDIHLDETTLDYNCYWNDGPGGAYFSFFAGGAGTNGGEGDLAWWQSVVDNNGIAFDPQSFEVNPGFAPFDPNNLSSLTPTAAQCLNKGAFAPQAGQQACGNGVTEVGEECDDGNTANDDACSPSCKIINPAI